MHVDILALCTNDDVDPQVGPTACKLWPLHFEAAATGCGQEEERTINRVNHAQDVQGRQGEQGKWQSEGQGHAKDTAVEREEREGA